MSKTEFACEKCHRVMRYAKRGHDGWGAVVAYLSGGLLYGREVDRPGWLESRRTTMNPSEAQKRRERIAELVEQKWTVREIARELGESFHRVHWAVRKLREAREGREAREARAGKSAKKKPGIAIGGLSRERSKGTCREAVVAGGSTTPGAGMR